MTTLREAAQQALEALGRTDSEPGTKAWEREGEAMEALRAALAEPVQEPVATVTSETGKPGITMSWWHEPALRVGTPLYNAPPQRKPLSEEEIDELAMDEDGLPNSHIEFARAIEQAHGIGEQP